MKNGFFKNVYVCNNNNKKLIQYLKDNILKVFCRLKKKMFLNIKYSYVIKFFHVKNNT